MCWWPWWCSPPSSIGSENPWGMLDPCVEPRRNAVYAMDFLLKFRLRVAFGAGRLDQGPRFSRLVWKRGLAHRPGRVAPRSTDRPESSA